MAHKRFAALRHLVADSQASKRQVALNNKTLLDNRMLKDKIKRIESDHDDEIRMLELEHDEKIEKSCKKLNKKILRITRERDELLQDNKDWWGIKT